MIKILVFLDLIVFKNVIGTKIIAHIIDIFVKILIPGSSDKEVTNRKLTNKYNSFK